MRVAVESNLRENQYGFRAGRSCVDLINIIRIILEQCNEFRTPIYTLFIDFKRAFDSINRNYVWRTLLRRGLPLKIVNIIKAMYNAFKCRVLHNGLLSEGFEVQTGVRQGCILSPMLFILCLDEVMRASMNERRGIQWTPFSHLEDLEYADDVCMVSHRLIDLETNLNQLVCHSRAAGLEINTRKTKVMCSGHCSTPSPTLSLGDECIDCVQSFVYLGSVVTSKSGADEDVDSRINKANSVFGMLRNVWKSGQISRRTKLRIFESNVKPVLFYGAETWKGSSNIESKIQTFINKCLRRILGIRWPEKIRNEDLWHRTQQETVPIEIGRRKWRWIGHTLRKPGNHIVRQALRWNPQGSRRPGAPENTWRRTIDKELNAANYNWNDICRAAPNRVRFRSIVQALCSTRRSGQQ